MDIHPDTLYAVTMSSYKDRLAEGNRERLALHAGLTRLGAARMVPALGMTLGGHLVHIGRKLQGASASGSTSGVRAELAPEIRC